MTPDGRYLVVDGRLWRRSNPALGIQQRALLVEALMRARRDVGRALRARDGSAEREARARVHRAKLALGERGPPWWTDGAPDFNRRLVENTPYAEWFRARAALSTHHALTAQGGSEAPAARVSLPPPPSGGRRV